MEHGNKPTEFSSAFYLPENPRHVAQATYPRLAWRNSPATLGLEMSEKPISGLASKFPRSAAMTANDSHESDVPRIRGIETAHDERVLGKNKRLNTQKPIIMSGFPARRPKIGFVSHPTPILERFLMFSIRGTLFRVFPFSSASIRAREWLCFEKCLFAGYLDPPTIKRVRTRNSGKLNKELE